MNAARYSALVRLAFADRLTYRGEALIGLFVAAARVLLAYILWSAVFGDRLEVGGMGLRAVMSYYLVAAFLRLFNQSDRYVWEFSSEIRSGNFSKYLIRPVDPLRWFLSVAAGRSLFHAGLAAIAALVVYLAVSAVSGGAAFVSPDPLGLLLAVPVAALGLSALALIDFMTSLLAFRFMDISAFHLVKGNLVELASGALVPLALMPGWARSLCSLTPFPALASLPAELWLGGGREGLPLAVGLLVAWNLALYGAARLVFASLSGRYEEVGA